MIGRIVCSKAGRDKGSFMVVVACEDQITFVCDGDARPLEKPKKKNIKHLSFTNSFLKDEQFKTNRALRRALRDFGGGIYKEENVCQNRI